MGCFDEKQIRYLEMIQGVIVRMSTNSFMLKGWAVTLVAGVLVLSAKDSNSFYFLIAYIPIVLFWFLDSYYLQLERKFRTLYKEVLNCEGKCKVFDMHLPEGCCNDKTLYCQNLMSTTEIGFYLPLALLVVLVVLISNVF